MFLRDRRKYFVSKWFLKNQKRDGVVIRYFPRIYARISLSEIFLLILMRCFRFIKKKFFVSKRLIFADKTDYRRKEDWVNKTGEFLGIFSTSVLLHHFV